MYFCNSFCGRLIWLKQTPKLSLPQHDCRLKSASIQTICVLVHCARPGVSGNSRSRPFPRMKASDSLSRIMGMDFFIPFPFPNFGNAFFSFPSRSRIMGMGFFHSLPVPELWEWIFFIPFPFPNCGNGFF